MSNPTSNFGWQMPTNSDLVTDLPADFEVFGQAVDTSLADLKGGTTGQVLSKTTNTDMDFTWTTPTTGMTNPMTTTGDTIYSSSGSTPARLGIGTTGQVLKVSGGLPTWATLTDTFHGCSVYSNNAQTINNSTNTIATYAAENFDTDGFHSTSSNTSRITIPTGLAGKYLLTASVAWTGGTAAGLRQWYFYKNGVEIGMIVRAIAPSGTTDIWQAGSMIVDASVNDYFEVNVYQSGGSAASLDSGSTRNFFQAVYLGA